MPCLNPWAGPLPGLPDGPMTRLDHWNWNRLAVPPWLWLALLWTTLAAAMLPLGRLREIGGDEGLELSKAAHWLRQGNFGSVVWNDQPLTHTRWYAWLLGLDFGAAGPRVWSVLMMVVLLASVGSLAQSLLGHRGAGFWAVVVVALAPLTLELSVSAMQEVPATACGMASLAAAGRAANSGPPRWLALSIVFGVLGMAIKLTVAVYVVAAFLHLFLAKPSATGSVAHPGQVRASLLYLICVVAGLAGFLRLVDGRPAADLLIDHLVALIVSSKEPPPHGTTPAQYLWRGYPWIAVCFVLGAVAALRRSLRGERAVLRVFLLPAVVLLFNAVIKPWWLYYSLSLWVGMAALAGYGISLNVAVLATLGWRFQRLGSIDLWRALVAAAVVLGGLAEARQYLDRLRAFRHAERVEDSRILAGIRRHQRAGLSGTIYSAEPSYAFWSGLCVAEELLVVTRKRLLTQDLQASDVPRLVARHRPDFVITGVGMNVTASPEWRATLERDYVLAEVAEGQELYVHAALAPHPYQNQLRW